MSVGGDQWYCQGRCSNDCGTVMAMTMIKMNGPLEITGSDFKPRNERLGGGCNICNREVCRLAFQAAARSVCMLALACLLACLFVCLFVCLCLLLANHLVCTHLGDHWVFASGYLLCGCAWADSILLCLKVCLHLSMIVIAIVHVMQFVYGQHVFYLHFLVVSTFGVLCAFLVCPICCARVFSVPTM